MAKHGSAILQTGRTEQSCVTNGRGSGVRSSRRRTRTVMRDPEIVFFIGLLRLLRPTTEIYNDTIAKNCFFHSSRLNVTIKYYLHCIIQCCIINIGSMLGTRNEKLFLATATSHARTQVEGYLRPVLRPSVPLRAQVY